MSFVHIKRQTIANAEGQIVEVFAVQAMAIQSPQGKKLIPNPSGTEACTFATLEEAEAAVRKAGFDYLFEGRKVFLMQQSLPSKRLHHTSGDDLLNEAIPALIRRLNDREPTTIVNAAFALGEIGDNRAVSAFIPLLGHEDASVRRAVAQGMAKLGEPAIDALKIAFDEALENKGQKERYAAHVRLTAMTAFYEMCFSHRELVERFLPKAVGALDDENWLVRAQAALVVGQAAQYVRNESLRN